MNQEFKDAQKEISILRETKGKEEETLAKIEELLPKAIDAQECKLVTDLYWQTHLVWKHKGIAEKLKPEDEQDKDYLGEIAEKMHHYAEKALDVVKRHSLDDMLGGAYRFLGRAASFTGDHQQAKEYYEHALANYSGKNEKNKMEVNAFLAESLIMLGEPEEGLNLAKKTYVDMQSSDLGKKLRDDDYFTWAVWMSGIPARAIFALMRTESQFNVEEMRAWLQEAINELENPSGHDWGDANFDIRLEELNMVMDKLKSADPS